MIVWVHAWECEHSGDTSRYAVLIGQCGGRVVGTREDRDAEEAMFKVEAADPVAFRAAVVALDDCMSVSGGSPD